MFMNCSARIRGILCVRQVFPYRGKHPTISIKNPPPSIRTPRLRFENLRETIRTPQIRFENLGEKIRTPPEFLDPAREARQKKIEPFWLFSRRKR